MICGRLEASTCRVVDIFTFVGWYAVTVGNYYQPALCNIPEEQRPQNGMYFLTSGPFLYILYFFGQLKVRIYSGLPDTCNYQTIDGFSEHMQISNFIIRKIK